jgi:hypothetical protein
MTREEFLRQSFVGVEVNGDFTEAVLSMKDQSRLCFRHRVGERWAKAVSGNLADDDQGLARTILLTIAMFRLNAKHLDIQFDDGSRWKARFRDPGAALDREAAT